MNRREVPPRSTLSKQNMRLMGIPREFWKCSLDDFESMGEIVKAVRRYINNIHDNFDSGFGIFFFGSNGTGKAQPLYSKILTSNGWVEMRNLKVGDLVYTRKGTLSPVTNIYPQGVKKCYRVHTLDGRYTDCCDEHLWTYYTSRGNLKTVMLRDMINSGFMNGSSYKFYIPNNECIKYTKRLLPIDPYVLGLMLGDGCMSEGQRGISISSCEEDVINNLRNALGSLYEVKKLKGDNYSWGIQYIPPHRSPLSKSLKRLGLRVKSGEKFIPPRYLISSRDQRLALLNGLMDTDGSVKRNGSFTFSTTSFRLFTDFKALCRSLGYQCSGHSYDRADKGVEYSVCILTDNIIFRSKKHLDKWQSVYCRDRSQNVSIYYKTALVSAEFIGYEEMQCISIEDPEHLYITDDFIVTHNTALASIILREAYRNRYTARRTTMNLLTPIGVKAKYDEDTEATYYEKFMNVEFLAIEEVGKEQEGEKRANVNVLEEVLRHRTEKGLPTFLLSNLTPTDFKERYGASIFSLINEYLVPVKMVGEDYRINVKSKKLLDKFRGE